MHARKTIVKTAPASPYMIMMVSGFAVGSIFGPFGALITMVACYWLTEKE